LKLHILPDASFDHHTSFSRAKAEECLEEINTQLLQGRDALRSASHLFITLGTAWAFYSKGSNRIVANCHKLPASDFARVLLSPSRIVDELEVALREVRERVNPRLQVTFTVSPVRHWKDGPGEALAHSPPASPSSYTFPDAPLS
jgi:hypothetical protein